MSLTDSTSTLAPANAPSALAIVAHEAAPLAFAPDMVERASDFARASCANATRRAYRSDWAHFLAWCEANHVDALPAAPETVALYLSELASAFKVSTIQRRLAAIAEAHRTKGVPSPRGDARVQRVLKGIRRTLLVAQKQALPLLPAALRRIAEVLPADLSGARDRALLLLGFAGGFRRSELVGLDVADLSFGEDGLTVVLRKSKTDQEGEGRKVGIPFGSDKATCPARAVKGWLAAAGIASGPVFRPVDKHGHMGAGQLTDHGLWLVVKRACRRAGIDPAGYSGHSLRAGLVTAAAQAGKSTHAIMKQTGHRSTAMVERYVRDADVFTDNAASGLGL
jgi:integrase